MQIEKNIPKPKKEINLPGKKRKYPFPDMKIDDSFLVELSDLDYNKKRQNIATACNLYKKKNPKFNFTVRKVDSGIRVWRIEASKKQF